MKEADEIFIRQYQPLYGRLYSVALAIVGNEEDAADAVQDAMAKIWAARNGLSEVKSPQGFAIRTLRSVATDMLRRRAVRQTATLNADPAAGATAEPDTEQFLRRIIATLPSRWQEVITLNAFGGLSSDEIAGALSLSADNVRQILSRGRRKIKEIYLKYDSL